MELAEWKAGAMRTIGEELAGDAIWGRKLAERHLTVHLAVFVEPWLSWLLDGTKTVESRFSMRRGVPYERVATGDVLLLKASSGPVVGICEVGETGYFDLHSVPLATLKKRFGKAIGADEDFWSSVQHTRYVTLLGVCHPRLIAPMTCPKRDRRGWVTFD